MQRLNLLASMAFLSGLAVGCHDALPQTYSHLDAYRARMLGTDPTPDVLVAAAAAAEPGSVAAGSVEPDSIPPQRAVRDALLAEPIPSHQPAIAEILAEIPDPSDAPSVLQKRQALLAEQAIEQRVVDAYSKVVEKSLSYLAKMDRPHDLRMSLEDAIRRALVHNYSIRSGAYKPAIEGTRLVEAEAAFDAEFFLDFTHARDDSAFLIQTGSEQVQGTSVSGGIRQLLPSGMRAQVSLDTQRTFVDNPNLTRGTNPSHHTTFTATVTQPLLRGFGLEVNRAQIEIARANRRIADWEFEGEVRDRLYDVESLYWQLVQSCRTAGVLAVAVAQNYATYIDLWERRNHDASPVEIANSRSRWQSRYVDYLEAVRLVKDAEDALKNAINDPELTLAEDVEIIPTDSPMVSAVALDQFAEVRTALDERSEVRQARESIESLKIATNVAKNNTLPQLDLTFNFESEGLDTSGDEAFDRLRNSEYLSYAVSVNFSYPFGNRAREAGPSPGAVARAAGGHSTPPGDRRRRARGEQRRAGDHGPLLPARPVLRSGQVGRAQPAFAAGPCVGDQPELPRDRAERGRITDVDANTAAARAGRIQRQPGRARTGEGYVAGVQQREPGGSLGVNGERRTANDEF